MEHNELRFVVERKVRLQLQRLIADGNTPQKIVKRARIILMTADGHGVMAIMREIGVSKTTVWRWQEYFAEAGVEGLVEGRARQEADQRSDQTQGCREDRERASRQRHALERAHQGIDDADLNLLEIAIHEDPAKPVKNSLGKKVTAWIGNVAVGTKVATEGPLEFYGLV